MEQEIRQLLNENIILARENNKMLYKLVNAQRWALAYRIFYWSIIMLSLFGSYFFLQPYLSSLLNLYSGGAGGATNIQDIIKSLDVSKLQEDLKNINQ